MEPTGFEHVAPGIERASLRTPTLPPATRTNTYILGTRRLAIVDPAPSDPAEQDLLVAHLHQREKEGARVVALVLTHHHADHVGATERLRHEFMAPVLAHKETASRVPFGVENLLAHGDTLPQDGGRWEAVSTPGHAAGHVCFLRRDDRLLICGDMLAGFGTILVDPDEGSMAQYLASLEALKILDPVEIFPAHGPSLKPGTAHVEHYITHRQARVDAIVARLRAGDRTAHAMVPHIYVGTPATAFPLAERSVLAMLMMLEERGVARRLGAEWIPAAVEE